MRINRNVKFYIYIIYILVESINAFMEETYFVNKHLDSHDKQIQAFLQ